MANIKSAKKRILTNERSNERNKSVRSEVRTATRRLDKAIKAGDAEAIGEAAREAQKAIGVAARKGIYHRNTAARKQSQIALAASEALAS